MTRDQAIARINRTMAQRPIGHSLTSQYEDALREAQRDLEMGKTLPKFLLLEDQTLTLLVGEKSVALPDDFLRVDDDNSLYYVADDSHLQHYLTPYRYYRDAVIAVQSQQRPDQPAQTTDAPSIYTIRGSVIDFVTFADREYELTWNYYRKAEVLGSDVENLWLEHVPELLIGEAGMRIAADARDMSAIKIFEAIAAKARTSMLNKVVLDEEAVGPIIMGGSL